MTGERLLDADMQTVSAWASNGLRWWLDELADLVPRRWRDRFFARRRLADYHAATGAIMARDEGVAPVAVILPPGLCLTRAIERPEMSQRDLESMLALESDRILPLAQGDAVLAVRIIAHDETHGRMSAEVAAIPLATARRLAAALAGLPRPCLAVYTADLNPGGTVPLDLLPALRRAGLIADTAQVARRLWLSVALLFALNIGLLIWRDVAAVDTLAGLVTEQQPAVNTARRITARIEQIDRFVVATRARRGDAAPTALLGQIATALPPGVWLQRFGWQGDSVRIAGYRPALTDVSAALRRAGFSVTRYSESAASGQSRLGQAFEITLRVRTPA